MTYPHVNYASINIVLLASLACVACGDAPGVTSGEENVAALPGESTMQSGRSSDFGNAGDGSQPGAEQGEGDEGALHDVAEGAVLIPQPTTDESSAAISKTDQLCAAVASGGPRGALNFGLRVIPRPRQLSLGLFGGASGPIVGER